MDHRSIVPPPAPRHVDLVVRAPGSKSITNRALICAGLAEGRSRLDGIAPGDDTEAMLHALGSLGIGIDRHVGTDGGRADSVGIVGGAGQIGPVSGVIDCGLAGTTSRFVSALVALGSSAVTVDGAERLRQRPMRVLFAALSDLGATIGGAGAGQRLPAAISGPLRASSVRLPGDVSSQFISALMMVGPYLDDGLEIVVETDLVSRPYVEMTAAVMEYFGGRATVSSDRVTVDRGGYRARDLVIEADASSASYPAALVAMCGGRVILDGVGSASLQGDRYFADVLEMMGCRVDWADDAVTIERDPAMPLRGVEVDLREASDLVPSVAVVAAGAVGTTRLGGIGFIRHKESDRIGDLVAELRRVGVDAIERADGLDIVGGNELAADDAVQTHHDHRLAMAFGVLASAHRLPLEIAEPAVVSKSWPGFWEELEAWCAQPPFTPDDGDPVSDRR